MLSCLLRAFIFAIRSIITNLKEKIEIKIYFGQVIKINIELIREEVI
jgi:hypothetical protein